MFIFNLLSGAISIYTLLCFLRIIMTWFPNLTYSKFTIFLANICDPYLNIFRKIRFLQIGFVDFSPALAIGILVASTSLLNSIALQQRLYIGGILASLVNMIWGLLSSLLWILTIIMGIRFIVLLVSKNGGNSSIWNMLDSTINPLAYKISSVFSSQKNKYINPKTALGISIIVLILCQLVGSLLFSTIIGLLLSLPF